MVSLNEMLFEFPHTTLLRDAGVFEHPDYPGVWLQVARLVNDYLVTSGDLVQMSFDHEENRNSSIGHHPEVYVLTRDPSSSHFHLIDDRFLVSDDDDHGLRIVRTPDSTTSVLYAFLTRYQWKCRSVSLPSNLLEKTPPQSELVAYFAARVQQILEVEYQEEYREVFLSSASGLDFATSALQQRHLEIRALCSLLDVQVRVEVGVLPGEDWDLLAWQDPDDAEHIWWGLSCPFSTQQHFIEYAGRDLHRWRIVHQQVQFLRGASPFLTQVLVEHVFSFLYTFPTDPEPYSEFLVHTAELFENVIRLRWERHCLRPGVDTDLLIDAVHSSRDDTPVGPLWPGSMSVWFSLTNLSCYISSFRFRIHIDLSEVLYLFTYTRGLLFQRRVEAACVSNGRG